MRMQTTLQPWKTGLRNTLGSFVKKMSISLSKGQESYTKGPCFFLNITSSLSLLATAPETNQPSPDAADQAMMLALPVRRWLLRGSRLSDDRMPPVPGPVIIRRGVSSAVSGLTGGAAWFDAIVKVRCVAIDER
jgi:hypothetical protein